MCNVGGAPLPGRAFLKHQKEEMPATGCVRWSETSQEGEAAPVASEDGVSLPLLVAKNRSGYFGVSHQTSRTKPYRAQLKRGRKDVRLGSFATAEEAAQCVARPPEGQAAAERAAASSHHAVQAASADTAAPDSAAADIVKRDIVKRVRPSRTPA